jgi:Serine phosphatase RsbU, regulator of sigma subunit
MKQKALPIVCAAFLIIAMTVQFIVSYRREKKELESSIAYKMELAQKDFVFEIYDMYEATDDIVRFLPEFDDSPDEYYRLLATVLKHFPDLYSCYITFLPDSSSKPVKWFAPCAFRASQDSIIVYDVGNNIDFPGRDWFTGALKSDEGGHWSLPYNDGDHSDPVFTHSRKAYDEHGNLVGIAGADYTLAWTRRVMGDILPYEDAICQLFSTDGKVIVEIGDGTDTSDKIMFEKVLEPTDMRLVIGVPKYHIREEIAWTSLITISVLLSGILIIGVLLHHIRKEHDALTRVETANKVIEKELQIAHDIQMGMLPKQQSAVSSQQSAGDGVQLEADLLPMREVGGDLYDFHREQDELWFIIGDVSGKGVPAAMFMSAAVNLFRAAGVRAKSPKEIMQEMNAVLSENNPSFTFVTAFIGCLHIPTGKLLYCNAGHCVPIVKRLAPSGLVRGERLEVEPNIPLGYDGKYQFVEQGCMLGEGETLVLYTDGVTEARNSAREMLGMKRWVEIIASSDDLPEAIKRYIGSAEPTDDITLMTITKTGAVQPLTIRVENKIEHWPELRTALHNYGLCAGMQPRELKKTQIAIEELVANIVNYSEADWMEMEVSHQPSAISHQLIVTLRDNGGAFDPTRQAEVDTDVTTAERQIGGLGIALVRQIADNLSYRRRDGINELTIIKNINHQ